eukprot:GILI01016523.1.p1 GENE.GILI01016523.1~~GILI01016523.1.p1  ORF type:complete len:288 (-),score=28.82 GILI01016523.1:288-1109(-)
MLLRAAFLAALVGLVAAQRPHPCVSCVQTNTNAGWCMKGEGVCVTQTEECEGFQLLTDSNLCPHAPAPAPSPSPSLKKGKGLNRKCLPCVSSGADKFCLMYANRPDIGSCIPIGDPCPKKYPKAATNADECPDFPSEGELLPGVLLFLGILFGVAGIMGLIAWCVIRQRDAPPSNLNSNYQSLATGGSDKLRSGNSSASNSNYSAVSASNPASNVLGSLKSALSLNSKGNEAGYALLPNVSSPVAAGTGLVKGSAVEMGGPPSGSAAVVVGPK